MLTEVDTIEYEEYRKKKPRGRGHWMFLVFHSFRHQAEEWAAHNVPYSIAKRRALKHANDVGTIMVSLDEFLSDDTIKDE